jgi:hypothetical protein
MRDFTQIRSALNLVPFVGSANGNLFIVPVAPGAPRIVVRRFDRDLPDSLAPVYASLVAAARAWIERDPELARAVRIEPVTEIGSDFLARAHHLGTPLSAYMSDEDPPEPPDELAAMQTRFRALAASANSPRDALIAGVLSRSILERSGKTRYSFAEEKFVIVDIKPTRAELERWAAISDEHRAGDPE